MKLVTAHDPVYRKMQPTTVEAGLDAWQRGQMDSRGCWDPDQMIRVSRWISFQYQRWTATGAPSLARKRDFIALCSCWAESKDQSTVLETTVLEEVSRETAVSLLNEFRRVPAEFFGREFARLFPGIWAWDYAALRPPDEFRQRAQSAEVIFAVDWNTGAYNFAFGFDALETCPAEDGSPTVGTVTFAVEFDTEQLDQFLAGVRAVKGWCEWNGEIL